jgi:hypothetical protein
VAKLAFRSGTHNTLKCIYFAIFRSTNSVRQLQDNPVTMVAIVPQGGAFESSAVASALKAFEESASALRGKFVFAKTSSVEVMNWMLDISEEQQEVRKELTEQVSVVRYEAGEVPKVFTPSADGDDENNEIDEWIRANTLPVSAAFRHERAPSDA